MEKEVFKNVLQKDEELLWAGGLNKTAYLIKTFVGLIFAGVFASAFLALFIAGPTSAVVGINSGKEFLDIFLKCFEVIYILLIIFSIPSNILFARNTYFAITDKRIIQRSGVLSKKFVHYSLKNIGNVEVVENILDSKGSANLTITTKEFHTNAEGASQHKLSINSLKNAYEAYNILVDKTEGNNEVLRVKNVK